MEPGRELDARVAEKVMELRTPVEQQCVEGPFCLKHGTFPKYSTSIEAAWSVVERLKGHGFCLSWDGECWNVHNSWHADSEPLAYKADLPHAICLAALKAINYER